MYKGYIEVSHDDELYSKLYNDINLNIFDLYRNQYMLVKNDNQASMPIPLKLDFSGKYTYDGKKWHKYNKESDISALKGNLVIKGHLNSDIDEGAILNIFNNHIGIEIGKVEKVNIGKRFNEIYFSSNRKLYPKSTFKLFRNGEEQNTLTAFDIYEEGKNKYKITTTQKVCVGDFVNLILDYNPN